MNTIVFILFQLTSQPDGKSEILDVAVTASESVCNVIAYELNKSPRKPEGVKFGCRQVERA